MRGKWVLFSVSVVLAAIAAGALSVLWQKPRVEPKTAAPATPPLPPGVEISLSGKVEAQHLVAVPAPVDGKIDELPVEDGQEVFEGQILARIKNEALEGARDLATLEMERVRNRVNTLESALIAARLEASRARAEASRSKGEYDRVQKIRERQAMLNREGATPRLVFEKTQKEFESAQLEYDALEARAKMVEERVDSVIKDLDIARKNLDGKNQDLEDATGDMEATVIHSPVDGVLLSHKASVGEDVDRSMADLFRIAVDLSLLQVAIEPEPPVLSRLRLQLPALVFLPEAGAEGVAGAIRAIEGNRVLVEFANPNQAVKPGLTAQVRIRLP